MYGLCFEPEYVNKVDDFCVENDIEFHYWAGITEPSVSGLVEYDFKYEDERKKVAEYLDSLCNLETYEDEIRPR